MLCVVPDISAFRSGWKWVRQPLQVILLNMLDSATVPAHYVKLVTVWLLKVNAAIALNPLPTIYL